MKMKSQNKCCALKEELKAILVESDIQLEKQKAEHFEEMTETCRAVEDLKVTIINSPLFKNFVTDSFYHRKPNGIPIVQVFLERYEICSTY